MASPNFTSPSDIQKSPVQEYELTERASNENEGKNKAENETLQEPTEDIASQHESDHSYENNDDIDNDSGHRPPADEHAPLMEVDKDKVISAARPPWTMWRRLGWVLMISLPMATLTILATLAFLWFLWLSNGRNKVLRQIMVDGWTTRVVSILSSVMRTSAAYLAGVCTSIVAAIALERGIFTLSKSAAASSMRYINSGPLDLLLLFWGGVGWKRKLWTALFVLALFITAASIQLTSTALLSDLKPSLVPGNFQSFQLPFRLTETYGDGDYSRTAGAELLSSNKPPFYPMFAEYSENPFLGEGVVDTGMAIRALLPLPSEQTRSLVRNYTGPATLFDSRVTCMRPSIDVFGFGPLGFGYYNGQVLAVIIGSVRIDKAVPRVYNVPGDTVFQCPVVFPSENATGEWAITLCGIPIPGVMVSPFQDPNTLNLSSPSYIPAVLPYFVINTTGIFEDFVTIFGNVTTDSWRYQERDEWLDLLPNANSSSVAAKFSITACYANILAVELNINAFSSVNRTEPSVIFDNAKGDFDSLAVREQLGATIPKEDPETRGIMSLEPRASWVVDEKAPGISPNYTVEDDWYGWTATPNGSLVFCLTCLASAESASFTFLSNRYLSTVFQHIIQSTGNPALAIQAYITTIFQVAYYEDISEFGVTAPSTMQLFESVLVPSAFLGLTIVTIFFCVHLVLVFSSIVFFRARTRYSMIKNSWQTVMQTFSPDTEKLFTNTGMLSDKEVEKLLASEGRGMVPVVITQLHNSERIGMEIVH